MGKSSALAVLGLLLATVVGAAPAGADPLPPECRRDPIFGLNPQVREICDLPMQPDGSWTRWRWFFHPEYVRSTCGDYAVHTQAGFFCPDWAPRDVNPATQSPVDKYVVTADTIPAGEPGYIGG